MIAAARDAWRAVAELPLCRAVVAWVMVLVLLVLADDGDGWEGRH